MIDQANGSLVLGGLAVGPATKLSEFKKTDVGSDAKVLVRNGSWVTLQVFDEGIYGVNLTFRGEYLLYTNLYLRDGDTWAEWSEEKELRKMAQLEKFLNRELGPPPHEFSWGNVEAVFDKLGACSTVLIRYHGKDIG